MNESAVAQVDAVSNAGEPGTRRIGTSAPRAPLELLALVSIFLLAVLRSLEGWGLYPDVAFPGGEGWVEIVLWILTIALIAAILGARAALESFARGARALPALVGFVALALLSCAWSAQPAVTLHRSLALAAATLAAFYLAGRYDRPAWARLLAAVCAALVVASAALALLVPARGADPAGPYYGAWNGIFWHKNQLGALLPLCALVFLFRTFAWDAASRRSRSMLAPALLLLSIYSLVRSNCAAGIVVSLGLAAGVVLARAWVQWGAGWTRLRLASMAALGAGAVLLLVLERGALLALLGRNETLTGRLSLWASLLGQVVPRHPWLGVGFGTAWSDGRFRSEARELAGWGADVMIADNGFLDILLGTGALGLLLFVTVFLGGWRRAMRAARAERTMASCFPPLFFLYAFLASLTFSLFAETELLVWIVMVTLAVQATRRLGERDASDLVSNPEASRLR